MDAPGAGPKPKFGMSTVKSILDLIDTLAKIAIVIVGILALTTPSLSRWLHADANLSGAIESITDAQRMTLREYRAEAQAQQRRNSIVDKKDYTDAELAAFGRVVVFSAQYRGARGRTCAIRYTVADAATGDPVIAGDTLMSVVPETNDDTYVWDVFVAEPKQPKSFLVTVELLDDKNFPDGNRVALKTILVKGT